MVTLAAIRPVPSVEVLVVWAGGGRRQTWRALPRAVWRGRYKQNVRTSTNDFHFTPRLPTPAPRHLAMRRLRQVAAPAPAARAGASRASAGWPVSPPKIARPGARAGRVGGRRAARGPGVGRPRSECWAQQYLALAKRRRRSATSHRKGNCNRIRLREIVSRIILPFTSGTSAPSRLRAFGGDLLATHHACSGKTASVCVTEAFLPGLAVSLPPSWATRSAALRSTRESGRSMFSKARLTGAAFARRRLTRVAPLGTVSARTSPVEVTVATRARPT